MAKIAREPQPVLYPTPTALVTCMDASGRANIVTIAWTGVVCSVPPMVSISLRPERFSHPMIRDTGEFVINLPTEDLLRATDICGTISGRKADKFEAAGLTPEPATKVKPPLIRECPVSLECVVRHTLRLGTHDMFIGEIVAVDMEESVLADGGVDAARLKALAYMPGSSEYWSLGKPIGRYGFTAKRS